MSEAAIITLAVVGGIVALFWIVVHYAYKLQARGRGAKASAPDYSVTIAGGELTSEAIDRLSEETRRNLANGYRRFDVN